MKKIAFEQLIIQVEKQSLAIKYDFEIADAFRNVLEEKKVT